ncbi:MBL fold metallo-hydrolase [Octadecabacter sp. R77987]|uniref:MBL fold metallo-hydrolase n=1 Tax=Octadecabacter sp. R77987 TaxID=3093874 RepID=UPI00366FEEDD
MDDSDFNPPTGAAQELATGLRRVLAPNPSPMTFRGTNTYLLGTDDLAVIDPGPDHPGHMAALLAAIGGARVTQIIVTHAHVDHSALAARLSRALDAPVSAFGDAQAGRSAVMTRLASAGFTGGGEGIDHSFAPDVTLANGARITGGFGALKVLHTPGHMGNHICLAWGDQVFTGDHVMGWASSLVSPPDGDLGDFMASCARLRTIPATRYHSGHGAPIDAPLARLDWLIAHREARTAQILSLLGDGAATPAQLTAAIYTEVPAELRPAAERNVIAHLVDLHCKNMVTAAPALASDAVFSLAT